MPDAASDSSAQMDNPAADEQDEKIDGLPDNPKKESAGRQRGRKQAKAGERSRG